jgi:hypothetical protein
MNEVRYLFRIALLAAVTSGIFMILAVVTGALKGFAELAIAFAWLFLVFLAAFWLNWRER